MTALRASTTLRPNVKNMGRWFHEIALPLRRAYCSLLTKHIVPSPASRVERDLSLRSQIATSCAGNVAVCIGKVSVRAGKVGVCAGNVAVCIGKVGVCTGKVGVCTGNVAVCTGNVAVFQADDQYLHAKDLVARGNDRLTHEKDHYTQVSLVCGSASSNPPLPAGEGKEGWV